MWEQMNIAYTFNMTEIWILNVGDLKMLEVPLEYFMSLAYDFEATTKQGIREYLVRKCMRDYRANESLAGEMADIMLLYSVSGAVSGADVAICLPTKSRVVG